MSARSVTDAIERILFAQAEHNYMSGARAQVEAELALTRLSIYHKPGYNRNWSWDYRTEARIRGGTSSQKQHDWEDEQEFRRNADADEPEGHPVLRDAGSNTIGVEPPAPETGQKIAFRPGTEIVIRAEENAKRWAPARRTTVNRRAINGPSNHNAA